MLRSAWQVAARLGRTGTAPERGARARCHAAGDIKELQMPDFTASLRNARRMWS
jgi:hypothetical protein